MLDYPERGDQVAGVVDVDPGFTATAKVIIDEKLPTFVDISRTRTTFLGDSHELLFRSERDGWARLYLINGMTGEAGDTGHTNSTAVLREVIQLIMPTTKLCSPQVD